MKKLDFTLSYFTREISAREMLEIAQDCE